jgi:hypothetical protein
MFKSIEVSCPESYKRQEGDWVVYIGQTENDTYEGADYTFWYEFVDVIDTPKDIKEGNYVPLDWSKHVTPLRKALRAANNQKKNVRLVFLSGDHESNAMALALATSECNMFKGKFTRDLFERYYINSVDIHSLIEFLGVRPKFLSAAQKFLPTRAKKCTRYELMGHLTIREAIHLVLAQVLGRDYGLIDYEIGQNDVPQPKYKLR